MQPTTRDPSTSGRRSFLIDARFRARFWWPAILLLGVLVYLYQLDGFYIPRIGDESPYIQIVRLTAESGKLLPLRTAAGLENTKPPFLFWLGILTTDWARHWSLFRLRVPIVLVTFLTVGLVFWLTSRITGNREAGYLSALTFLGFRSTYQYGRPFLTNLPETLFAFLPFALLIAFRNRIGRWGIWFWILMGVLLGTACLFKSFVLVVPFSFALLWLRLVERGADVSMFLRQDVPRAVLTVVVALACFALWPALDPDPGSVVRQFVLEENIGKLGGEGYGSGLFTGPYALYRIWLGPLASAGLFALPLIVVAWHSFRKHAELRGEEKALWIFVFSFLLFYSFPAQRQENYILPTMPALAVLLGIQWRNIHRRWHHLFLIPVVLGLALVYRLMFAVSETVVSHDGYDLWQLLIPGLALFVSVIGYFYNRLAPFTFHLTALLALLSLAVFLAPFEGPAGRFRPSRSELLVGKTIYVPSSFISKYERHRFILPGARVEGYDPEEVEQLNSLLRSRKYVVVHRSLGESVHGPYRIFGKRLDLRTRQSFEEILRILFLNELDLFIQEEYLIRRPAIERERRGTREPPRS